ncbi:helix-turn-helix domain-containing protein [Chitinophaga sp. S165]|uniref:winged helix-turn-helix transcriptional regulator n=1 Tax=Chitinophaga sp. S165 TaxID=2135462 RepID=UPI000D70D410|nr:helix-turn-helix domain-containing protein [Chitinophaga sp. S165]PWV46126.1 HxlR family transcriptional regulator [Chitinophaga sp. S165]
MQDHVKIHIDEADVKALQDTIYVIGGKWKLPIIHSICNGNKRFTDIEQSIPFITKRMLSLNLKELEANKLITRKVDVDASTNIEYEFTEYAKEYGTLITYMIEWGKKHKRVIVENS